jgi:hypothetical protein
VDTDPVVFLHAEALMTGNGATTAVRGRTPTGPGPTAESRPSSPYFSSRDSRRSARGFPPVWQVGQYCSAESANETSLIVSPQAGHS